MTEISTPFVDSPADSIGKSDEIPEKSGSPSSSLESIAIGEEVCVAELALEAELAAWLRAVGIGEGDRVSVLRSGAFGGPLHVRNSDGGEFALNRQLARCVLVNRQ